MKETAIVHAHNASHVFRLWQYFRIGWITYFGFLFAPKDSPEFICWIGEAQDQACDNLAWLANHILENPAIHCCSRVIRLRGTLGGGQE